MKLNIANPKNGIQKIINIENENDLRIFYDKKITNEIDASELGPQWKGFVFKITGGQDKQGFPMKEGVLTNRRVKLLLKKGTTGCRGLGMKDGERTRKSVRGCYVSPEIAVLNLLIVKEGNDLSEYTNLEKPKKSLVKRISKIRKLFSLSKGDDIKKYIIEDKNKKNKRPKIQRLITPLVLQRKRAFLVSKKKKINNIKKELIEYGKTIRRKN